MVDRRVPVVAMVVALLSAAVVFAAPVAAGGCTISGTPADDVLRGTPAADVICGRGGDDVIIGRGGDDELLGGGGEDLLKAGPGADDLLGGTGADELLGGIGDDVLKGGIGSDILDGGAGLDFCAPLDVMDVLTNCEDVRAPRLQELSIEPSVIDTSAGPQTVTIRAHITDDESGVIDGYGAQIYSFSRVFFTGPDGTSAEFYAEFRPGIDDPERTLTQGTPQDGHYEVTVTLPQYSAQGRWKINYVSLEDETRNHRYIWPEDLASQGFPTGFDQVGVGDSTPPDVSALELTPDSVDTSQSPAQIQVSATVTDDLSGVDTVLLYFRGPGGRQWANTALSPAPSGNYEGVLTVPRFSEQGTWTLEDINLRDKADNHGALQREDLAARGFPTSFEQIGAGDAAAPELLDLDFTPKQVDTRYEDQVITVTARLADAMAGISDATLLFQSPTEACGASCPEDNQGLWVRFTSSDRVSGDARDGVYEVEATLPRYSELGTWTIFWFQIRDHAGNELFLIEKNDHGDTFMSGRKGEVSALGFPVSFTNGGLI